ncbi:hypothetical protein [Vibrio alginolyticus]|uniref:hypothetical protein n=1 Tax=Vibrio alginolyticus TaxID=663 RepID=UPI00071F3D69|nr:hypothetical protein [Vibrio alginolyticus]ALR91315.1 hypothetical protein AT730_02510 [Vibrio alginolyticus]MBY7707985.1 hypothetical protein [Vibrio alginolyticus]
MTTSAEMILKPKIDENKMREEAKKQERVMKNTAKQMEEDIKNGVENGMEEGAESGVSAFSFKFKVAAATLALAAAALVKDTFDKVTEGAEAVEMDLRDRINAIQDITSSAKGLGIDRATYAGFTLAGQAQGIEQDDIRGIFETFVGSLNRPEMADYKEASDEHGIEKAFLDFMGTLSLMDPEQAARLNDDVMGGDALRASKFMEPIRKILEDGGELTTEKVLNSMMGGGLDLAGLRRSFDAADPNIKKVMHEDAIDRQRELKNGLDADEATNINRMTDAKRDEKDAQESVFDMKVDRFVVEKEMTVAQLKFSAEVEEYLKNLFAGPSGSGVSSPASKVLGQTNESIVIEEPKDKPLVVFGMEIPTDWRPKFVTQPITGGYDYMFPNDKNKKTPVQEAEEHARHNQNRNDVGAHK